jgi:predicted nucleic acid-binding protein
VSRLVIDASVVLTWCFPDEDAALAQHVADRFKRGDTALVPSFWPHEVLNALLAGDKRGRIPGNWCVVFSMSSLFFL